MSAPLAQLRDRYAALCRAEPQLARAYQRSETPEAGQALRDLWERADETLRAIVAAGGKPDPRLI